MAAAASGAFVIPKFPEGRDGQTDFNDLANFPRAGMDAVKEQIEAALEEASWGGPKAWLGDPGDGGKRRRAVSVMPLDDAVERFCPLDDGSGKFLFDTWTMKVVYREQMSAVLPAGERWDQVKRHSVWIDRGAYYIDEVGFDPAGVDPSVRLNTWRGWPMEPKKGKCDLLLELIHYLCNRNQEGDVTSRWLLQWMAYPLQDPGAKMLSALNHARPHRHRKKQRLESIPGDLRRLICLFSASLRRVISRRALEDKSNSDWGQTAPSLSSPRKSSAARRCGVSGTNSRISSPATGSASDSNKSEKLRFSYGKMIAAYRQRNHMNLVFLSNEDQPLPIDKDDRRS
uniref:Uncharacterized protein n=1 Tax=Candidatus Kentrum sp. DK TaxID=2126562 RepID=A0A450TEQ6_9GAMM|nr:MAG: hypothetical protein BECKDK2373B_GA0170837_11515 [Candidatus Kentron sp. DK]